MSLCLQEKRIRRTEHTCILQRDHNGDHECTCGRRFTGGKSGSDR